jgi:RNA polymerase sigma-70 factor (ECF subfamily)
VSLAISHTGDSTSFSLLARAQRHEPQAWERLTALYGPLVYGWCRRAGVSADDAADVCQEVFRAVSRDIVNFRHDGRGGFRAWLRTITKHRVCDHFTERRRNPRGVGGADPQAAMHEIADPAALDSDESQPQEQVRLLHAALQTIRGDFQNATWTIFWRSTIEGHETAAIAADLGMTPKAVRQARHRVLKRLREELHGLLE